MRKYLGVFVVLFVFSGTGCTPALIGAGAAGGFKVGTDERSVGQMWDDVTITARVNAELHKDRVVKAARIDVDTSQQVVTLTGVVASEEVAHRAAEIAGKVVYVKDVKNYLQVGKKTFGESFDDKLIGSKIKARLIGEKDMRSMNIDVDVVRRIVTLTGVVNDQSQKDRAIAIARRTLGVTEVNDNLTVRGTDKPVNP